MMVDLSPNSSLFISWEDKAYFHFVRFDTLLAVNDEDSPKAFRAQKGFEQTLKTYTDMVMTHFSSTASPRDSLNIGLQSSLLRSSRLMANILEQIGLSTSQWFRNVLYKFYPRQDDFRAWNRISEFQRTKTLYSPTIAERERRTSVLMPYILQLNQEVLRHA